MVASNSEMAPSCLELSDAALRNELHNFIDSDSWNLSLVSINLTSKDIRKIMHAMADSMDFRSDTSTHGNTKGRFECGSSESASNKEVLHLCNRLINNTRQFLAVWMPQGRSDVIWMYGPDLPKYQDFQASQLQVTSSYREKFLERAALPPPPVLRVIDIEATCCLEEDRVVLVDYWADASVQHKGYSAISHTYGMEVYEVFDCQCTATKWCTATSVSPPRCSDQSCPHADDKAAVHSATKKRNRVVKDILRMCANLRAAGVQYAWHDGVCIRQFDPVELKASIMCMGWIYSNAKDTVVFLHYVGNPMAPIRNGKGEDELTCRWHTRVWTLQEAAMSKCRRYCVRVGTSPLDECQNLEEFEEKIALWYRDETSKVEVIDEQRFYEMLSDIWKVLMPLCEPMAMEMGNVLSCSPIQAFIGDRCIKGFTWVSCIYELFRMLDDICFRFPNARMAMLAGSKRESKHAGDRINSILALTGVDFVAPKESRYMEASSMEFFKRQGREGLEFAVFTTNDDKLENEQVWQHSWLPVLEKRLYSVLYDENRCNLEYRVVDEDGMVEVRGKLLCVEVEFTVEWQAKGVIESLDVRQEKLEASLEHLSVVLTGGGPRFASCIGEATVPGCLLHGYNFRAHLVLPMDISCFSLLQCTWPALIVQGHLNANVQKIGCFELIRHFVPSLMRSCDRPFITTLQKLVIR